ncbi:MAG TPA: pyridoxal-phosphate dependent enzyme [Candidatus Limnocylindrales bacterium]|nr:pyridoxal-phosphate dependent enzyme [Candidatus Limnocylindrales bacterium]
MRVPDLPRFRLLDGPSPLTPVPRFVDALGGGFDLWLKREDLLPLAFGGNKLRNLEFLVGAALAEGADALVTSGRRWSNHARLTAAAGARAGLEVHLVLSGPPASEAGPNARVEALLGATVHQLATAERAEREAAVDRVAADLRARGRRPYVIGVGGSGALGALGQALAALELLEQLRPLGGDPDDVILPSATGGTQAGILVGLRAGGAADARVRGMAVARPPDKLRPEIERLAGGVAALLEVASPGMGEIELDPSTLGSGYGIPSTAAGEAATLLARTEGVLVDPVYTAKALGGLIALARGGELAGRRVVFWHAGGTPGIFEELSDAG